ncbi:MAG: type IV pilus twitching motility protein PilT [Myxococcaceae bacterium]
MKLKAVECIRELRASGDGLKGSVVTSAQLTRPMEKLLAYARERGASDLHLTPGEPPIIRVDGVIERLESKRLEAEQVNQLLSEILDPVRKPILEKSGAADFCYAIPGVGRYRANVFKMKRGLGGVFRVIPNVAPQFADLHLPKHLNEITTFHQGILLVTGPAGSGKSTTLTALVNVINETRNSHVLTFEDPVEFLHQPLTALINQREIGKDSDSYAAAMRGALREDPDVIVVGELRDSETIQLALLAAETGHLVVATMQTNSAVATIDKLVESFPPAEQQQVRTSLSESLKLIVSQQLVPKAGGKGRVSLVEILKSTSPVRSLIRDGKTFQLPSTMVISRSQGMQTLDGSIEERLAAGLITIDTAIQYADKKDIFQKRKLGGAAAAAATEEAGAAPAVGAPAASTASQPGAAGAARRPLVAGGAAPGAATGVARPPGAAGGMARPPGPAGAPGAAARPGGVGGPPGMVKKP